MWFFWQKEPECTAYTFLFHQKYFHKHFQAIPIQNGAFVQILSQYTYIGMKKDPWIWKPRHLVKNFLTHYCVKDPLSILRLKKNNSNFHGASSFWFAFDIWLSKPARFHSFLYLSITHPSRVVALGWSNLFESSHRPRLPCLANHPARQKCIM